jgi:hypothetical protein
MSVKNRMVEFKTRIEPTVFERIIKEEDGIGAHLVNKKVKEKYKYYMCDYCGQEIRIADKWAERTGSKVTIPSSITKQGEIVLALHNKCLKPMLKELEEE